MQFTKIKQIEKGWSSYIYLVHDGHGGEFVMKAVREKSPRANLYEREGQMLELANSVNVGPKLINVNSKDNYVVMEYIKGKEYLSWLNSDEFNSVTKEELYFFLKELYRQLLRLDTVFLSHNQISGGRNILVTEKVNDQGVREFIPTIIDFETAKVKIPPQKTKNIGQFRDYFFENKFGWAAKKVREKLDAEL